MGFAFTYTALHKPHSPGSPNFSFALMMITRDRDVG